MTVTSHPQGAVIAGSPFGGLWIRALAFLLDTLVIGVIVSLVTLGLTGLLPWDQSVTSQPWGPTLQTAVGFLYFTMLWSGLGGGQTIGMRLTGLRVVALDGHPISFGAAILRWIGMVVSAAVVLVGLLWIAFDPRQQGWHDKLAGTVVVRDEIDDADVRIAASVSDATHGLAGLRVLATAMGLFGSALAVVGVALAIDGDRVMQPGPVLVGVGLLTVAGLVGGAITRREPVMGAAAFLVSVIGIALAVMPRLGPWYDGLLAATVAGPVAETAYWFAAPSIVLLFLAGTTFGVAAVLALAGIERGPATRA